MANQEERNELDAGTIQRYNNEIDTSAIAIRSLDDISRISKIFIGSGMFKGDKSLTQAQQVYQAGVKIIAGVEFGIQPFAAMRGINIINGNAEMSANLMAGKVKKHPKYDYKVTQLDNDGCRIMFYEIPYPGAPRKEWEELGESSFTHEDAVAAQLAGSQNWRKFARNMYFARAISNGVRFYTPDVFYGAPVYVEGEISGEFDTTPRTRSETVAQNEDSQTAEAEAVPDHEDETSTKADPVEAEVIDTSSPDEDTSGSENDEEQDADIMATVAVHLSNLELPTHRARQLVRETTGKPFLKNCNEEDLVKLAEEIELIEKGEKILPADWYEPAVMEKV